MKTKKVLVFHSCLLVMGLVLGMDSGVWGQGLPGTAAFSPPQPAFTYDGWLSPGSLSTGVEEQHLGLQAPLMKDGNNTIALSGQGAWLHFGQSQVLSAARIVVPEDLWSFSLGGQLTMAAGPGQRFGGSFSIGSASDHPFAAAGDVAVNLSGFYLFPDGRENQWLLAAFFSNNGVLPNYVPIPGFAYIVHAKDFNGTFGFPFLMIQWGPFEPWSFSLSVFGPNVNSEIALGKKEIFQGFAGFNWGFQSFIPENRPEAADRLYFAQKKVFVGARFPVASGFMGELRCGSMFDQSVYEGTFSAGSNDGSAAMGGSLFMELNLRFLP